MGLLRDGWSDGCIEAEVKVQTARTKVFYVAVRSDIPIINLGHARES